MSTKETKTTKEKDAKEKKPISPLKAAELPTGAYRAGFRLKAVVPGVARGSVGRWSEGGAGASTQTL